MQFEEWLHTINVYIENHVKYLEIDENIRICGGQELNKHSDLLKNRCSAQGI